MNTIWTENNKPFNVAGVIQVGIYPYPGIDFPGLKILDLERKAKLAMIISGEESLENVDAAVCSNKELSIGIRTRDCAPICFGDGKKIAIAHIGWQGFSMGLIEKTLSYFNPETVTIYVGPFLHAFEIQKDFCYDALMAKPGTAVFITEENGKILFRFKEAIQALLPEQSVFDIRNTGTDTSLPSNRRDKDSKGFLTTVSFA
jgi:copper oxidase (laccase) domain-containing protein